MQKEGISPDEAYSRNVRISGTLKVVFGFYKYIINVFFEN